MTSKISYSKFIKEDIRHRGWLAVLSAVLLLLCVTVSTILFVEASFSNNTQAGPDEQFDLLRNVFPALLNGSYNLFLTVLLLLLGALCAVTGFAYLHSRERTDFYHSLPLSRKQLFFISYLSGLVIFLVPYLAACVLTILAGSGYGFLTISVLGRCGISMLGGTLAFLLVYHITILAMMLTGKVVTGILAAASLFFYGSITGALAAELPSFFLSTYCTGKERVWDHLYDFLSSLSMFTQILGVTAYHEAQDDGYIFSFSYFLRHLVRPSDTYSIPVILVVTAVFLAALLLLTLLLYQKRPSEAAENALAFPRTAPYIKVLISIPTALCIGVLAGSMYGSGTKWIILLSLLAVVLLCGLIEFIYNMDVRRLFAGKYSTLISVLGVAGILCVLQLDLFGYNTWFPEENSLESMSLDISQMYGYFTYPNTAALNAAYPTSPDFLYGKKYQQKDFAPIYALAREGVENTRNGIDKLVSQKPSEDYVNITVRYNRKLGYSVYRRYAVSADLALETLTALCEEENYRKQLFPIFYVDYDAVSAVHLTDIYFKPEMLDLTRSERDALLDAYKKDVLNVDIKELQYETPIGELSINIPEILLSGSLQVYNTKYNITLSGFYLYESYENSLSLLKEYGYTIRRKLDPDDVEQFKLMESYYTADASADDTFTLPETNERIVTDPDEIADLVSRISYASSRILGNVPITGQSAEIFLKGSKDTSYYSMILQDE